MKLYKALEIGKECGLETVGECISNIKVHSDSFFTKDSFNNELLELEIDYKALKSCTLISDESIVYIALELLKNESVCMCIRCYKSGLRDSKLFGSLDEKLLE